MPLRTIVQSLAFATALFAVAFSAEAASKKLKVFILVGQSNMEGHAKISTFDYIGDDPKTAPLLKAMVDKDGKPTVCDRVWISNLSRTGTSGNGFRNGKLTAGYGARSNARHLGEKIGPEFTFGLTMQAAYDGPVLLIKCAWGGKSLHTDFRPPSAGPYRFSQAELLKFKKEGKDLKAVIAEREKESGHYYRLMMEHVKKVLADPGKVVPAYDKAAGYEIGGFVWFQGWNDMVFRNVYPNRDRPGGYDLYSKLLAMLIQDVRKDLKQPKLPFVIGVMGVGGPISPGAKNKTQLYFRQAMAVPAKAMGGVVAVETAPYWDKTLGEIDKKRNQIKSMARKLRTQAKGGPNATGRMTAAQQKQYMDKYKARILSAKEEAIWNRGASNAGYHYLGCGKTMAQIGYAFALPLIRK